MRDSSIISSHWYEWVLAVLQNANAIIYNKEPCKLSMMTTRSLLKNFHIKSNSVTIPPKQRLASSYWSFLNENGSVSQHTVKKYSLLILIQNVYTVLGEGFI